MEQKIRWEENYGGYLGYIGRRQVAWVERDRDDAYYPVIYPVAHLCVERFKKRFRNLNAAKTWCEAGLLRDWKGL